MPMPFVQCGYGIFHSEVLQMVLFVRDNDVDVIARAQAMIRHAKQAVCVGRQIDADYIGALIGDHVKKSGILVSEPVVILTPDKGRDEQY